MRWPRLILLLLLAISLPACGTAVRDSETSVPYEVLLNNYSKTAWKPYSAQTEAFLFLDAAKDLAAYPITGTVDPSAPFPPTELEQVNFHSEVALFMTRGLSPHRPTGLVVTSITRGQTGITVKLNMINPGDKAPAMEDFRVTLVKIPRDALPSRPFTIHFVEKGKAVRELTVP